MRCQYSIRLFASQAATHSRSQSTVSVAIPCLWLCGRSANLATRADKARARRLAKQLAIRLCEVLPSSVLQVKEADGVVAEELAADIVVEAEAVDLLDAALEGEHRVVGAEVSRCILRAREVLPGPFLVRCLSQAKAASLQHDPRVKKS